MTLDVLDWTAPPFLSFYVVGAALSLAAAYYLPPRMLDPGVHVPRSPALQPPELAFLAGGRERAADVLLLQEIATGHASISGQDVDVSGVSMTRRIYIRDAWPALDDIREKLAGEGLAFSQARQFAGGLATIACVLPVFILGLAKIQVGQVRDKPVGILGFLMIALFFACLVVIISRLPASRAGRQVLSVYRAEHERAIRAPLANEVIAAFAFTGAVALAGTVFDSYRLLLPQSADGGGGCGGGDGGGGGGGCGGCGGGD